VRVHLQPCGSGMMAIVGTDRGTAHLQEQLAVPADEGLRQQLGEPYDAAPVDARRLGPLAGAAGPAVALLLAAAAAGDGQGAQHAAGRLERSRDEGAGPELGVQAGPVLVLRHAAIAGTEASERRDALAGREAIVQPNRQSTQHDMPELTRTQAQPPSFATAETSARLPRSPRTCAQTIRTCRCTVLTTVEQCRNVYGQTGINAQQRKQRRGAYILRCASPVTTVPLAYACHAAEPSRLGMPGSRRSVGTDPASSTATGRRKSGAPWAMDTLCSNTHRGLCSESGGCSETWALGHLRA